MDDIVIPTTSPTDSPLHRSPEEFMLSINISDVIKSEQLKETSRLVQLETPQVE